MKLKRLLLTAAASVLTIACAPAATIAAASPAAAENGGGQPPNTPDALKIIAFFDAYASGDPETYRAWLLANRTEDALAAAPIEARLEQFADQVERWGGLQVQMLNLVSDTQVDAVAVAENDGRARSFSFHFPDGLEGKIGAIEIDLARPPGADLAFGDDWADLAAYGQSFLDQTGVPAIAVGVMKNGEIVDQAVLGTRTIGGDPVSLDDTFHWGSVTKSVTGTVIAGLVEDGVLDWDMTLAAALPDMAMRDVYKPATLWQLMSHQAGIAPMTNFQEVEQRLAETGGGRAGFVASLLNQDALGEPGTVAQYSNGGVTIAGYVAEQASGKTWRELVQAYVFDRAGMSNSGFDWPYAAERPDQPRGHFGESREDYRPRELGEFEHSGAMLAMEPAGNVRSSIADMLAYGKMHVDGLIGRDGAFKAEPIQRAHAEQPGDLKLFGSETYTAGWGHGCPGVPDGVRCEWHNGSGGTFFAALFIVPDQDLVIAVLTNAAQPMASVQDEFFAPIYRRFAD